MSLLKIVVSKCFTDIAFPMDFSDGTNSQLMILQPGTTRTHSSLHSSPEEEYLT